MAARRALPSLVHMFVRPIFLVRPFLRFSSSTPKSRVQSLISLIGEDGKIIGVKTKAEAEAIAKSSNLLLKRQLLPPGQETKHPAYVLYDPKSEFDEPAGDLGGPVSVTGKSKQSERAPKVREKKKLQIGANINDHDVETKAKSASKFLKANCEVQVIVYGHVKNERLEEIYKLFEGLFPGLRFVQKVLKPSTLKFTILPDPDKFTGLALKHGGKQLDLDEQDAEIVIDDKEVDQLVNDMLKKKR